VVINRDPSYVDKLLEYTIRSAGVSELLNPTSGIDGGLIVDLANNSISRRRILEKRRQTNTGLMTLKGARF